MSVPTQEGIPKRILHFIFIPNCSGSLLENGKIQALNYVTRSIPSIDEIVKKWAQNSISRILPFLVKYFNDFAYRAIGQYPRGYDEQVKFMNKSPRFVLDKSIIRRLLTAFGRLYPRLGYEFDKMIMELPDASQKHKIYMEELRKKWKQQEICEHVYKEPPTMTLYGYYGKQCSICHYIKRVKNPNPPQKR